MLTFLLSSLALLLTLSQLFVESAQSYLPGQTYSAIIITLATIICGLALVNRSKLKRLSLKEAGYVDQTVKLTSQIEEHLAKVVDLEALLETKQTDLKSAKNDLEKAETEKLSSDKKLSKVQTELDKLNNNDSEASLLTLLSTLQKKGRFLDFVMGDISKYPDDRVGAVARVVHSGCSEVIHQYFEPKPVSDESPGSKVTIEGTKEKIKYNFNKETSDDQPVVGELLNQGWQASKMALPQRLQKVDPNQLIISPADVKVLN